MSKPLTIFLRPILVVLLFSVLSPLATAVSPIMLRVTKKEGTDIKSRYQSGSYSSKSGSDIVQYNIDVINGATNALTNVKISWAILVKALRQTDPNPIIEGEQTTNLERGEKFSMATDVLELGRYWRSSYSGTDRTTHAEIQGYVIEVIVDGKVAVADIKPPDTKKRIDQLKAAKQQDKAKQHNF